MYSEDMFKEGIPLTSRKFHRILDFYLFHCPVDGTSFRATTFEQQGLSIPAFMSPQSGHKETAVPDMRKP